MNQYLEIDYPACVKWITPISALLSHVTPLTGFGFASRLTPGYAHATWDAMVAAVESLEHPSSLKLNVFAAEAVNNQPKADETRKVG